jgi:hypothetical protein
MFKLYNGRKYTGVSVQPDPQFPTMFRIHQGDFQSDMVNLARAKDAALSLPFGKEGSKAARWHAPETPREGQGQAKTIRT